MSDSRGRVWPRMGVVVRVVVSVGLIALLVGMVDLRAVGWLVRSADLALLALAAVLAAADRLLMAGKWFPLLAFQVQTIPFWRAVRAYIAANFASVFLPTSVGGDVLRAVGLGSGLGAVAQVGASILAERVLGVLASGVMALGALAVARSAGVPMLPLVPWLVVAATLVAGVVTLALSPRVTALVHRWLERRSRHRGVGWLERFAAAYRIYHGHGRTMLSVGLLSIVEQAFPILILWLIGRALGTSIELPMLAVAVPLSGVVDRLPIAIWGIGVAEGSMVWLLGLFGVPAAESLAVMVVARVVGLLVLLPGALWWGDLTGRWKGAAARAETDLSHAAGNAGSVRAGPEV